MPSFIIWLTVRLNVFVQLYVVVYEMEELEDYICVGQQRENGDNRAVLFVKMRKGFKFTSETKQKIGESIAREIDDYFIPECIVEVPDIPVSLLWPDFLFVIVIFTVSDIRYFKMSKMYSFTRFPWFSSIWQWLWVFK